MSVTPDMLQRIREGAKPQLPGGGQPGPAAAPMASPQPQDGTRARSSVKVRAAIKVLEQVMVELGSDTKEGSVVLKVLDKLIRTFGEDTSDLEPQHMRDLFSSMPQMGGGSEQQKAIAKMMAQKQQQPQGAPPGAPPQ